MSHTAYAPYRVCPLGAHIDHQDGIVTGFALNLGSTFRFDIIPDALFSVTSDEYRGTVSFSLASIPPKRGDWGDYPRAAAYALYEQGYQLTHGVKGHIGGPISVGGLSSSASVVLCYLQALCLANDIHLSQVDLIKTAQMAENRYVGLNNGILDQSCEVLCRPGELLVLDTRDASFHQIPAASNMPDFGILVIDSGVPRTLGKGYNLRVDEAKSASYELKALDGMPYGLYSESKLRDVPEEVYERHKARLPESFSRRAAHYYGEMRRVREGVEAWKQGDIERFGKLVFASGKSSIELWETGCPELKEIQKILETTDGVWGARFSGAGFKGCSMALVDLSKKESIQESVTTRYLKVFSEHQNFRLFWCSTGRGAYVR